MAALFGFSLKNKKMLTTLMTVFASIDDDIDVELFLKNVKLVPTLILKLFRKSKKC
jgi:hypothetical protein